MIVGNDQRELFREDNLPSILIYTGREIENIPLTEEQKSALPPGVAIAEEGNCPPGGAVYPGASDFALALVDSLLEQDFDVAQSARLPKPDGHVHGIPHAFGFLYRRIMEDHPPPTVPIFLNAGIPPNQPRVKRCLKFGPALLNAIQREGRRQSGAAGLRGADPFVIDEELDRRVIKGMQERDEAALAAIPERRLLGNTCEIKLAARVLRHERSRKENDLGGLRAVLPYRSRDRQCHGFRPLDLIL